MFSELDHKFFCSKALIFHKNFFKQPQTANKNHNEDIRILFTMRVLPASDKYVELQYLSLAFTTFRRNWSTFYNSKGRPKRVLGRFEISPFAAHFRWYFFTHYCGVPPLHQYATLLCQLILRREASPKVHRIPTTLSMLNTFALTINKVSSTY